LKDFQQLTYPIIKHENSNVNQYESPNQESLVPDAEWLITEGFPAGGQYVGITAIFEEFFPRLHSYFSVWESKVNEMLDGGDCVVALGYYSGRAKLTGTAFTCPFVHIWKLSNGKIVQFRQCAEFPKPT
jgi:hypothetical protein